MDSGSKAVKCGSQIFLKRKSKFHQFHRSHASSRAHVYPLKSPLLIVSINCSVARMISCRRCLLPSSSSPSMLLEDSDESLTFSSEDSFALAMTLLPVRNVYFKRKFCENRVWDLGVGEILLEKFLVASIVVRIAPFNFRRALNFFKQSTVS